MPFDECNLLKPEVVGGGVYSEGVVQRFANESKDVSASTDNLNHHSAHAQKALRDVFGTSWASLARGLQNLFC